MPDPVLPDQATAPNYLTGVMQANFDLMVAMLANGKALQETLNKILKIMEIETNGHS